MIGRVAISANAKIPVSAQGISSPSGVSYYHTWNGIRYLVMNATTNIVIGNEVTDGAVFIDYVAIRGSLYQQGEITALNGVIVEVLHTWFGDDVGLTVAGDVDGDDLRINITVDDSSVDHIIFNYVIWQQYM